MQIKFPQHLPDSGHIMGTVDNEKKALNISSNGPYIDTIDRFWIFSESKKNGWGGIK